MGKVNVKKDTNCPNCGGKINWRKPNDKDITIGISVVIVEFAGNCSQCKLPLCGIASSYIEVGGYDHSVETDIPQTVSSDK